MLQDRANSRLSTWDDLDADKPEPNSATSGTEVQAIEDVKPNASDVNKGSDLTEEGMDKIFQKVFDDVMILAGDTYNIDFHREHELLQKDLEGVTSSQRRYVDYTGHKRKLQ